MRLLVLAAHAALAYADDATAAGRQAPPGSTLKVAMDFDLEGTHSRFRHRRDTSLIQITQSSQQQPVGMVQKLLSGGADAKVVGPGGYTALHWAAVNGHAEVSMSSAVHVHASGAMGLCWGSAGSSHLNRPSPCI